MHKPCNPASLGWTGTLLLHWGPTSSIKHHVLQVQRLEGLEGEVANLEAMLEELAGDLEASGRAQATMQRRLTAAEGELARARRAGGSAAVGDCTSGCCVLLCSGAVRLCDGLGGRAAGDANASG